MAAQILTFDEIMAEYNRQCKLAEEYNRYRQTPEMVKFHIAYRESIAKGTERPKQPPYTGFKIEYGKILDMLVNTVEAQGLSRDRAVYIVSYAHQEKHACFENVIIYCQTLVEFVKALPKE